jgi:opacity protein-like surface antigen
MFLISASSFKLSKIILTLITALLAALVSAAQSDLPQNQVSILGGYGNYESFHAGIHLSVHQKYFLEAAIGMSPWSFTDDYYVMEYGCLGIPLKKNHTRPLDVFLQWKLLHWDFDDEDTKMSVLATGPEVKFTYRISSRFRAAVNGGIVYNAVLKYQRKIFEDVGWIDRFGPSFSLQCSYFLK